MRRVAIALTMVLTTALLSVEAQQAIVRYDIGDAFNGSSAYAINRYHTVVGDGITNSGTVMFTWNFTRGIRIILPRAHGSDINNRGHIVGHRRCRDTTCHTEGFVWSASAGLRILGDFHPEAINDTGDMAGQCQATNRACAIVRGRLYVLHSAPSAATDINNDGVVSGSRWSATTRSSTPFVWSVSIGRRTLDKSPWFHGYAEALNDYGQVVGALVEQRPPDLSLERAAAVRWRSIGRFTAPGHHTWAKGIENHGWVVGYGLSSDDPSEFPILWRSGRITRLPLGAQHFGGIASDINESGVIAGTVFGGNDRQHAAVWQLRW
jgi:uncharacterized membrane protein